MQTLKPDIIILPTFFQIIAGSIILFLILKFFVNECVKNFQKKKSKPQKVKNDIKKRLEKANRQYYKKFNKQP